MFSYCNNNPVGFVDATGDRPIIGDDPRTETPDERHASSSMMKKWKVVDLTEKLIGFMNNNARLLSDYKEENGYIEACLYFYKNVRDNGELDIKLQDEWSFEKNTDYYFYGTLLRYDDPGNINYGYIGAILFDLDTLCLGAGLNQISKYGLQFGDISTCFDDPRDNEMIKRGFNLYTTGKWYYD